MKQRKDESKGRKQRKKEQRKKGKIGWKETKTEGRKQRKNMGWLDGWLINRACVLKDIEEVKMKKR